MLEQSTRDKIQNLLSSEDIQNINIGMVLLESFLEQHPKLLTSMFPTENYWSSFSAYHHDVYIGISILVLMHRYDYPFATNLTRLDIQGKNIHIPDEIVELTTLRSLSLTGNRLTEVPDIITQLHQLQYLDLSNNHLSDLPVELFDLIELQYLDISSNRLLLISPLIAKLKNLRYLYIMNNRGFPPRSLWAMQHLIEFDIATSNQKVFKYWKRLIDRPNTYKESIKLMVFFSPLLAPILYQVFLEDSTIPIINIISLVGSLVVGSMYGCFSILPKYRPADVETLFQSITHHVANNSLNSLVEGLKKERKYNKIPVFHMLLIGLMKSNREVEEIEYVMQGEKFYRLHVLNKYKPWLFINYMLIAIEGMIIVYDQQLSLSALIPVAIMLNTYLYVQLHNLGALYDENAQRLLKILKERNESYNMHSS